MDPAPTWASRERKRPEEPSVAYAPGSPTPRSYPDRDSHSGGSRRWRWTDRTGLRRMSKTRPETRHEKADERIDLSLLQRGRAPDGFRHGGADTHLPALRGALQGTGGREDCPVHPVAVSCPACPGAAAVEPRAGADRCRRHAAHGRRDDDICPPDRERAARERQGTEALAHVETAAATGAGRAGARVARGAAGPGRPATAARRPGRTGRRPRRPGAAGERRAA